MAGKKREKKLSQKQEAILLYIEECIVSRRHPPAIREIQDKCRISSTSVVDYNLKRLEEMGFIDRQSNVARGIQVLKPRGPMLETEGQYNIPLYGTIAAGEPISTPANDLTPEQFIEVARSLMRAPKDKTLFALRVKGHSMVDALVADGDIVILAHQETADNGDMVAAQVRTKDGEDWTLKRFFRRDDKIELRPANPTLYSEQDIKSRFTFPGDAVTVSGKVCLVLRQP